MHLDDGANIVAESWQAENEGMGDAALPVHVAHTSSEAAPKATHMPGSDEELGLLAAIRRLESVVEEETVALSSGQKIDFDEFSIRKSRSMLEFVRLMRAEIQLGDATQVIEEIRSLRQKLERNRTVLEMHFEAVREVAAIIVRAIREAESDGTYSAKSSQETR